MQVMLDLETLSTEPNAAIVSIGAVKFDGQGVVDRFHVNVDLVSCSVYGRHISARTTLWWLDTLRDTARVQTFTSDAIGLPEALDGFAQWFGPTTLPVWGNSAAFDNAILASAYDALGYARPWKFWDDRCYRTVKNLAPEVELERVGTFHKAVDDAESQALHLIEIAKYMGFEL
jgi:3' exoribonuclease, RNase T-like